MKVPNTFFTELLPAIDDLAELKVTLHCLWLLSHKQGDLRYTRLAEIAADDRFMAGLAAQRSGRLRPCAAGWSWPRAGARCCGYKVRQGGERRGLVLPQQRARPRGGGAHPARRSAQLAEPLPDDISLQAQRPHIFLLYEQNIGMIQPMLAEELREAERTYPQTWLEEAFRIAVELNVRHWKYIRTHPGALGRRGQRPWNR